MSHKVRNYGFFSHFSHYVPGVADLFVLLLWFLLGLVIGNAAAYGISRAFPSDTAFQYATLVSYPLMFIPAMMFAGARSAMNRFKVQGLNIDSSHFGRAGGFACALLASVSCAALSFCSDAVSNMLPPMPEWLESALNTMTSGKLWVNLLCVSIMAPLFEEWLCRGMVLRGLLGHGVRPVPAILVSALFFALIHANLWQAIPAFLMGCLFGYVYYRTGSFRLTMLMHCVNNTLSVLMTRIDAFEDADNWLDIMPERNYWLIFAACALFIVMAVRYFSRIRGTESGAGGLDRTASEL